MPMIPDFKFVLSNAELPGLADWQAEIGRWDLLFPVTWLELNEGSGTVSALDLAGKVGRFSIEKRPISDVVSEEHADLVDRYEYAYAFGGQGDLESSLAAGISAFTCATLTGGASYWPESGVFDDPRSVRQDFELTLAVQLGRLDDYHRRYPQEPEKGIGGPATLSITVHRG